MGLKKLFSTKEKPEKERNHRRSSSRASSLISNWTHKNDIKQPSSNSSASFVSSPTTTTLMPTAKVTQSDEAVVHPSRPITPSDSMRDVYPHIEDTLPIATPHAFTPRFMTMDSNKFEVDDGVSDATDDDSATKDSLYQELLLVKQQLDAVNPSNAVDIKRRLTEVNQLLTNALDSSSRLDTKLKSVIDTSKQALIAVKDENTTLKTSLEGLEEQLKDRQTKLDEYRDRHHQLSLLFDEDNTDLQDKVKHVLFLNEKHAEEKKVLKNQFDALQMKSENDAMTMKQMKLKLESCTTQIRDLQAENTRLLAENADCGMASELAILKKTLESTKVENLELQSTVEATQNQLLMLRKSENVSSLLELENKQLRQKLIDMEAASREETDKLLELVESLKTKVNDTATAAEEVEQDELMRMHTRAQLGLIEYLEGEENVPLAMAKFKKQLETEMREFGLTSHS